MKTFEPLKPGDRVIVTTLSGAEYIDIVDRISSDGIARLRDTHNSEHWSLVDHVRRVGYPLPATPEFDVVICGGSK